LKKRFPSIEFFLPDVKVFSLIKKAKNGEKHLSRWRKAFLLLEQLRKSFYTFSNF